MGFMGALQLAFIILRLCSVIDWPWWVVLLPAIAYAALCAVVFAVEVAMNIREERRIRAFREERERRIGNRARTARHDGGDTDR